MKEIKKLSIPYFSNLFGRKEPKRKTLSGSWWYTLWEPCCFRTHLVWCRIGLLIMSKTYLHWASIRGHKPCIGGLWRTGYCVIGRIVSGYLRGWAIALNIWYYEVTCTRKKVRFGRTPRILCYQENSFRKQVSLGPLLASLEGKEVLGCCCLILKFHLCINVSGCYI